MTQTDANPWDAALTYFGGKFNDPGKYDRSVEGFQQYLTDGGGGVNFSAHEMVTPHRPAIAQSLGYDVLLPPYDMWIRGLCLNLVAQTIRDRMEEPVVMRNWWRPVSYNNAVTQAHPSPYSDHIFACAVDLDYRSAQSCREAKTLLDHLDAECPWLKLSLGYGERTTHVGMLSAIGRRRWSY